MIMIMIDMEMPKKCQWDCLFCADDGGACMVADVKTSDTERPKDCPLKEVEEPCESAEMICEPNALMKFKFSDGTVKYVKTAKIEEQEDCISRVEIEHIFANLNYECAFDMPSFWANKGKDYKVIPTNWHKGYQKAIEDIENAVKKLPPVQPKENVGEWVSVKDRLPEEGERVLICPNGHYGNKLVIAHIEKLEHSSVEGDFFWDGELAYSRKYVTHWHPLPKPYKESEG